MKIRNEIEKYAAEKDRPALRWLFERYHFASEWRVVARCHFDRCGDQSYMVHRVWVPSAIGLSIAAIAAIAAARAPGATADAANAADAADAALSAAIAASKGV